jgi:hypothetical protein
VLGARKLPGEQLDPVNRVDTYVLLVVSMEVRPVVRLASLDEHADHDAEEARDLWHDSENINTGPHDT